MLTASLAAVALACAAPVPPDDPNAKALKVLQGKWKTIAAEERGEAGDPKDFDVQLIAVKGNTFVWIENGKEAERFTIKFDLSKSPAHLDLVVQSKDGPQGTCHAIYKLEGGRLTICFARVLHPTEAKQRPSEFKTGPADQRPPKGKVMYVFERVKE